MVPLRSIRTLRLSPVSDLVKSGFIKGFTEEKAIHTYVKVAYKGVIKVLSKMGISTIQSYTGAQIFEALGISNAVVDEYFALTPARIGGVGLDEIAREAEMRHGVCLHSSRCGRRS